MVQPSSFTDPPYAPDCPACDGQGEVEVTQVARNDGQGVPSEGGVGFPLPTGVGTLPVPVVPCPWCRGSGIRGAGIRSQRDE